MRHHSIDDPAPAWLLMSLFPFVTLIWRCDLMWGREREKENRGKGPVCPYCPWSLCARGSQLCWVVLLSSSQVPDFSSSSLLLSSFSCNSHKKQGQEHNCTLHISYSPSLPIVITSPSFTDWLALNSNRHHLLQLSLCQKERERVRKSDRIWGKPQIFMGLDGLGYDDDQGWWKGKERETHKSRKWWEKKMMWIGGEGWWSLIISWYFMFLNTISKFVPLLSLFFTVNHIKW